MNLASQNITVDSVEKFKIYENCKQLFPCKHTCEIELIDDRKWKTSITGDDIYILIQEISKEKISFIKDESHLSEQGQGIAHFDKYEEYPYEMFNPQAIKTPNASELITSIFNQLPKEKEHEFLIDKGPQGPVYDEVSGLCMFKAKSKK